MALSVDLIYESNLIRPQHPKLHIKGFIKRLIASQFHRNFTSPHLSEAALISCDGFITLDLWLSRSIIVPVAYLRLLVAIRFWNQLFNRSSKMSLGAVKSELLATGMYLMNDLFSCMKGNPFINFNLLGVFCWGVIQNFSKTFFLLLEQTRKLF